MKLCKMCGKEIGIARLKANPNTNICSDCIMADRGKEYDDTFDEIESLNVPEEIKQKLRKRTAEINREKENLDKKIEKSQEKIREDFKREKEEMSINQRRAEREKEELEVKQILIEKEKEELIGKHKKVEREKIQLKSLVEDLKNELNKFVLNNELVSLQDNQILMYINEQRKSIKSPLLTGKININRSTYSLAIWSNVNSAGEKYWKGYVNDINMDGKLNNRYILFRKETETNKLVGQIIFGTTIYDIVMERKEYPLTHLIYWKGLVLTGK